MHGVEKLRPATMLVLLVVSAQQLLPWQASAQGVVRGWIKSRFSHAGTGKNSKFETAQLAGLQVAIWRPRLSAGTVPLVLFSHGFHGRNTQTDFLMQAMADSGYLVIAPNHKDAIGMGSAASRPEERLGSPKTWSDRTYRDRAHDITSLIGALHADAEWNSQIDWSRLALAGHSLGGYTMLGLAGAWPSWKIPGVKAVLALSPYCQPFVQNGDLGNIKVPVMYQTGTRDLGVAPFVVRKDGAFDKTSQPKTLVVLDRATHFAWTSLNRSQEQRELIDYYSLAFLDRFVKGDANAKTERRLSGVTKLEEK